MDTARVPLASPQCNAVIAGAARELPSLAEFGDEPEQTNAENLGGIVELFDAAISSRLKWPRIRLQATDGNILVLSRAGEHSQQPGIIRLTDGTPYPSLHYWGSIGLDGTLHASRQMTTAIRALLVSFNESPTAVAIEQATLSGNCIFCRRRLSDPRSVTHGHGKRCAEIYSLRWDAPRACRGLFGDAWSAVSGAELVGA